MAVSAEFVWQADPVREVTCVRAERGACRGLTCARCINRRHYRPDCFLPTRQRSSCDGPGPRDRSRRRPLAVDRQPSREARLSAGARVFLGGPVACVAAIHFLGRTNGISARSIRNNRRLRRVMAVIITKSAH